MTSNGNNASSLKRSTRREFLGQTTVAVAAASALANASRASEKPVQKVTTRVLGANDRINVAFIGCGMRYQNLMRTFQARKEKRGDVECSALCDVWEPRLKFAQDKVKAEKTYKDHQEIVQRSDIDGVVIAVPDHWHYLMARDVLQSGKDVYLEKPMTYTIDEGAKLNDLVSQAKRILQVGGSGPATRLNWKINEYVKAGKMGKILWALISYNRNTDTGMWDYPIPGVGNQHWADAEVSEKNLDWKTWLGPARSRAFSPERYFRWRKYWEYSGGNATDLLYHRLGAVSTMIGFDFPTQVVSAGGIYIQKDREVPDTYMTQVEYPGEYCVNMISCMGNATSAPVSVYGNWGTLEVAQGQADAGEAAGDQQRAPRQGGRARAVVRAERQFLDKFKEANGGRTEVTIEEGPGEDLMDNWLNCMRSREVPVYNVLRGYQVMVAIRLGVDSYREGRAMAFDPATRRVLPKPPARKAFLPAGA